MDRKERIYAYICHEDYKPLTMQEMCIVLDVPNSERAFFSAYISELISEGKVVQSKKGRLKKAATSSDVVYGIFKSMKSSNAYVKPIDAQSDDEDIFISKYDCGYAFEGDTVAVKVFSKALQEGKHREGKVSKVIHHGMDECIGTIKEIGSRFVFVPDVMMNVRAIISKESVPYADGQKAMAKIERFADEKNLMKVRITEIFGDKNDVGVLTECIIRENNIPEKFSDASLMQAQSYDVEVHEEDIIGRADFRSDRVITIDGEDARDLDDAVCVKKGKGGEYTLYVHIADVSHYVRENTAIDIDAFDRATSVYLPDRVIPMLPRELSNGICSLNEGVDRLTMSVTMEINPAGDVVSYSIEKGVIRSLHRMTYTNVTLMLEGDDEVCDRYKDIYDDVCNMKDLAMLLKKRRTQRGAVDFNFPEPKIVLDENGNVLGVKVYETGISNEIIEQFMLLANETVARHACDKDLPFVFRVHEEPSEEKIISLQKYLNVFSVENDLAQKERISPADIQKIVDSIKGTPQENSIGVLCLRSMMKARYMPENLGHFGLASEFYCHFTSPIRRYPDLAIHRVLTESMDKGIGEKRKGYLENYVKRASEVSSDAEVRAVEAERMADKMCECLYMKQFIGEEFDATVSSVTDFGLFVEVCGCIEGLVPINMLSDDYYVYEDEFLRLRGERFGRTFGLGDCIRVRLIASSARLRRIDFEIVDMKTVYRKKDSKNSSKTKKKREQAKKQFKSFVKKKGKKRR